MNGHMQKQLTRSLERILEEAHISGELKLSGRKLKDFPKVGKSFGSIKYNLKDTVLADLSKNRFVEFPEEITEFSFLEKLYLYHNAIRVIPETVTMLQSLSYLDLSRNQMTSLPREICRLPLQTLLISHNRIASLPDELGRMSSLAELDAGCNEIAMLPFRMGDLTRLRILDLHNNFLVHIPIELTYLKLIKLNISGNRISVLPNEFRKMKYLIDLQLLDNPLTSPPAALCIRGRTHVFKYLERQAIKHERSLNGRIKLNTFEQRNYTTLDILSNRQCSNDSSIGIIEGDDKNWSQNIDNKIHNCEIRNIFRKECLPLSITLPREVQINDSCTGTSTPSTISPGENISLEDEFEKMAYIVNQINEEKTRWDIPDGKVNLKNALLSIHQPSIIPVNQIEHSSLESTEQNSFTESITKIEKSLPLDKGKGTLSHIQTYREYKEALRQQRVNEGPSIYKSKEEIIQYRFDSQSNGADASNLFVITNKHTSNEESANKIPVPKIDLSRINIQNNKIINDFNRNASSENLQNISLNTNSSDKYSFTMKREFERAKEEADLIKQLRNNIETRLKMALPENLAPALTDGVVLCHLANHVQPRSVASIHVPSPAVPKLTMARCRRNVDNFLDACRKIGVEENLVCCASDILEGGRGVLRIAVTVTELLMFHQSRSPSQISTTTKIKN